MSERHVLVVSPDERWLRVLEVTLRLGGYTPLARRSVVDALRIRSDDDPPRAIVLDLGPDSTTTEVDAVREVLGTSDLRAVVILPERLAGQRGDFSATGAAVLVRPYPPSALYEVLGEPPAATASPDQNGAARESAIPAGESASPTVDPQLEGSTSPSNS